MTRLFSAEAHVRLRSAADVMAQLREHFGEHGAVSGTEVAWSVTFELGKASASLGEGGIAFKVEAGDDTSLSFLQWSVADHLREFARGEEPPIAWRGGITPGAPLPYFREMTVVDAVQLTPRMRRLTLSGENLERFARFGLHVRLLFPPRPRAVPVWPVMGADGRQSWPAGERPVARVYTIRRIDVEAGEIDIDFVLHEGEEMPGATFGAEARPGAVVGMTGPGGGTLAAAAHYILAGDETALPAIGRMLEELPVHARAKVLIEIADPGEKQALAARPGMEVEWLSREGRAAGTTTLLPEVLRALPSNAWEGDPYIWVGCEHAAAREIRDFLGLERQLSRKQYLAMAYWRRGRAGEAAD